MNGKTINRRKKTSSNKEYQISNTEIKKEKLASNKEDIDKNKLIVYLILLMVITFGVFSPTFKNELTNWDDGKYIPENPLIEPLNVETVNEIFFSEDLGKRYWMGNYHPLTMLSLNVNYALASKDVDGNVNPKGFQFFNILLHVFNTLLVFFIIQALLKNLNIAFFAALLFGVHTLHVESVTWVAERKDVLYTFFFLSGLLSYIKYTDDLKIGKFILAFALFFLSLLSKGQAVSLAVTIILIDYFRERELLSMRVIVEKFPFFALAIVFGLIAVAAQKQGSALQVINTMPIVSRIGVASFGFSMYLLKLFVPIQLCAVYPYPDIVHQTIPGYFWLGLIAVALTGFSALKSFKKDKIIFIGIGFFAINIFLLLQLLPVGSAMYADRYAYIPSIGFYLVIAYFLTKLKDVKIQYLILGAYVVGLSVLTVNRIGDWKDSTVLWEDVVVKQPNSVVAWNNLGSEYNSHAAEYLDAGDFDNFEQFTNKAIECFNTAINRKPDYTSAFYNRGFSNYNLAEKSGDTLTMLSALEDFNRAISSDIEFFEAYLQRGIVYTWLKDYERAIIDFDYALNYRPKDTRVIVNRGTTKGRSGDYDGAIADFNLAISIDAESTEAYSNRGLAYVFKQEYELAIQDYNKALSLEDEGQTHYNRAMAYFRLLDYQKAIDDFEQAILLGFVVPDLYYYKAFAERNLQQFDKACEDMQTAVNSGFTPALSYVSEFCGR